MAAAFVLTAALAIGLSPAAAPAPAARALGGTAVSVDETGAAAQAPETITEFRVHGNNITPDADIITLAGVATGTPFGPTTIADITARLRASKKFQQVTVLKRFASIADPSQIVIVIIVDEGPVRIEASGPPGTPLRVVKRGGIHNLMFMPILSAEDGYGLTYGARLALVGRAGENGRMSFPLTWGGLKQAGAEYDRTFTSGPFSRIEVGGSVRRQKNPAFEINDDRQHVWARAERAAGPVRAGATGGWQRVSFDTTRDHLRTFGADVAFDTRIDPLMPRNAVYARASWEHIGFSSGGAVTHTRLAADAYVGVIGQNVFVVRLTRDDADRPLAPYLKPLLGGWSNLRGFKAGAFVGDTVVTGSAELRIPLSSPLDVGKLGVSVFMDTGVAYDKGQRLRDQTLRRGVGGSVWISAAILQISLSVAHGIGGTTRVNFGAGLNF